MGDEALLDVTRAGALSALRHASPAWTARFSRARGARGPLPDEAAENIAITRDLERLVPSPTIAESCRRAREEGRPALGEPFAPSWPLLSASKDALRLADLRAASSIEEAERLADEAWRRYLDGWPDEGAGAERGFTAELRASFRRYASTWSWVLGQPRVVLGCMCSAPRWWRRAPFDRCHRFVVARALAACGARYRGELVPTSRQMTLLP